MVKANQLSVVAGNLQQREDFSVLGSIFVNIKEMYCFDAVLGEWLDQGSRHGRLCVSGFVLVKCARQIVVSELEKLGVVFAFGCRQYFAVTTS